MQKSILFLICCVVLAVLAQDNVQVREGNSRGGPHIVSRNKNAISKVTETEELTEDNWEADELAKDREEQMKAAKEQTFKRRQDEINNRRMAAAQDGMKEKQNQLFLRDLDRAQEQGTKKAAEGAAKSRVSMENNRNEDVAKFEAGLQGLKLTEEVSKRKVQQEKEKFEALREQGEKTAVESKEKQTSEQAVKEETDKRRAQVEEKVKVERETVTKKLEEQRQKEEQKEKQTAAAAEEKVKGVHQKDEQEQKKVARTQTEAERETQKKQEALQKKTDGEQTEKRKQQEQAQKKCIPLQVWSSGWPNNVWQFKRQDQIYNKNNQGYRRGYNIMILNPNSFDIRMQRGYDTHASQAESRALADELENAPSGSIIMIACQDECSHNRDAKLMAQFQKLKLQYAQRIGFRHSYAAIVIKGKGGALESWPQNNAMASVSDNINC